MPAQTLQVPVADSPVYLDGNATTPIDPQVVQSMAAYDQRSPGNPSSAHVHGARAETALRAARGEAGAVERVWMKGLNFRGFGPINTQVCGV